jgi:hypothetical protein
MRIFEKAFGLIFIALFGFVETAHACSVCYGDPDSPQSVGLFWGVLFLLGMIVSILGWFIYVLRKMARRSQELEELERDFP